MLSFVLGNIGNTVSDPGWVTGLGEGGLVELAKADRTSAIGWFQGNYRLTSGCRNSSPDARG